MVTRKRIGLYVPPSEPFWVQVREAIYARSQFYPIDIISLDNERLEQASPAARQRLISDFFNLKLHALVFSEYREDLVQHFLTNNTPVVSLSDTHIRHPLCIYPHSLYDAAYMLGQHVAGSLGGKGNLILLGGRVPGNVHEPNIGGDESRITGFYDAFHTYPNLHIQHIATGWRVEEYQNVVRDALYAYAQPIDALVGLSDPIVLNGRKILRSLGLIDSHTIIAGINGDPLALAEIIAGRMSATIAISTEVLGETGVDLAYQLALGESIAPFFSYRQQLVTPQNVLQFTAEKFIAIAELPSRLVGTKRQEERHRLAQFETSLAINQQVGIILNRQQLAQTAVNLIAANYHLDHVRLWLWQSESSTLKLEYTTQSELQSISLPVTSTDIFGKVLESGRVEFMMDSMYTITPPEHAIPPETQVRIIVPIRFAGKVIGLLDLLNARPLLYTLVELEGLLSIADQLGIAIRNAQLYEEAVTARTLAERTNQLKTRLLANVSHELRTPLLIILGYTELILNTPDAYQIELPAALIDDLQHIYQSGQHLVQLSNDLLDLSRAEIGALDLHLELLEPSIFLAEVFARVVEGLGKSDSTTWQLDLPPTLPKIRADQLRLRQIILNLLSNAAKHAIGSHITLGAQIESPHLHFWVKDTGPGIAADIQEAVFEPFFTASIQNGESQGIGLGLTIARRLTTLHGGSLSLESTKGQGSTFHVYFPLPTPERQFGYQEGQLEQVIAS